MTNSTELPTPREVIIEAMAVEVEAAHEKHVIAYSINRVKTYGWQLPAGSTGQESEPKSMAACIEASDAFDEILRRQLQDAFALGHAAGQSTAAQCLHKIQEPAPVQAAQPASVSNADGFSVSNAGTSHAAQPIAWPKNAQDVRDFFHADFITAKFAAEDQTPCDEDRHLISAHDFLSAVNWWANFPHIPRTPQAAPAAMAVPDELILAAKQALACMDGLQQHLGRAVCQVEADALRAALAATPAAAVPVAMTELDASLLNQAVEMLEAVSNDLRKRGSDSASEGAACSAGAVQRLAAALLAGVSAPAAQWLQPKDWEALQRFEETASDNQGHDIGKAAVARLAGFGCLQSHGFGVYSITDFGHFVLDDWEHARALPFRTQAERDADQRAAIAAQAAQQGGAA